MTSFMYVHLHTRYLSCNECLLSLVLSWGHESLTHRKQPHEKAHFKSFSDFSSQMKDELPLIYQLLYKKMSEYLCQSFDNLKMLLTVLPNFFFPLKASNLFLGMHLHSKNLSFYLLKILKEQCYPVHPCIKNHRGTLERSLKGSAALFTFWLSSVCKGAQWP